MTTAYLGLDLHATTCTLGIMAEDGTYQGHQHFSTAESELIPRTVEINARTKHLALEEGTLARWAARTLEPYVDDVFVCDPRENALISRSPHKSDAADAYKLCRLLRLGELKRVYQAQEDHRALFKAAVEHYLDMRGQQVALKQKIKAQFRRWGVLRVEGHTLYSNDGRVAYLERLSHKSIASQLGSLYQVLDVTLAAHSQSSSSIASGVVSSKH